MYSYSARTLRLRPSAPRTMFRPRRGDCSLMPDGENTCSAPSAATAMGLMAAFSSSAVCVEKHQPSTSASDIFCVKTK